MTEVLQFSDFVLKVSFFDISGKNARVTNFKFCYSTPLSKIVEISFDGVNYSNNCTPTEDGVLIAFESPRFNVGQLSVHRQYKIESPYFENGQREVNQIEPLNIEIVTAYTRKKQAEGQPTPITSSQENIILTEVVVLEAFKGAKGDPGMPAINYSLCEEQVVEGEFFVGRRGEKKQVYTRTWLFETTFKQTEYGIFATGFAEQTKTDTLFNVSSTKFN